MAFPLRSEEAKARPEANANEFSSGSEDSHPVAAVGSFVAAVHPQPSGEQDAYILMLLEGFSNASKITRNAAM
ncbi:glucan 1,4-beta-glucosidase [Anopheles sinensis]|uniref:Glucan 1,4-beta-glucosidase n=1 Tax=Anopheles sinensis TaxID=74873 RepID=A0A084VL02_ANOSI|nr:glucan 1,4-beta-glucosidase [Anopheles sinensis]